MAPRRKIAIGIAAAAGIALIAAAVVFGLWRSGCLLPSWVQWNDRSIVFDLDGDGSDEVVTLAGKRVSVEGSRGTCSSVEGQFVSDAMLWDFDNDGATELLLVAWKIGSFGPYRPFWVDEDSEDFSEHIFVYRYAGDELEEVWLSSDIGFDAQEVHLDGAGRMHIATPQGETTVWEWDYFGFSLVEENGVSLEEPEEPSSQGQAVTLLFAGDNIAHASVCEGVRDRATDSYDFTSVYEPVVSTVEAADIACVVQETPLVDDAADVSGYPYFGTPSSMAQALANAGFDIAACATNHALDKGETGVATTLDSFDDAGMLTMGIGRSTSGESAVVERNGISIAFANATYGTNGNELGWGSAYHVETLDDVEAFADKVAQVDAEADFTVCVIHCGEEYASAASDDQRVLAQRLTEAGADAIICSHTHTVLPVETVTAANGNTSVCYYGLGNFMAAQDRVETLVGGLAGLTVARDGKTGEVFLESYSFEPTVSHFDGAGQTQVFLLADYTDALAARHYLGRTGYGESSTKDPLRLLDLHAVWKRGTGQ